VTLLQDRKTLIFACVAAGLWAVFSLGYVFGLLGPGSETWFANIGAVVGAWSVAALAILLWRSYDPDEAARRIWLPLMIGFFLWAIGDSLWAYYDLRTGADIPYPSLADIAWTVAFPFLWVGLWRRYRSLGVRFGRRQWLAPTTIVVVGLIAFGAVLWPILTYAQYDRLIERVLDVFYPVGELILFASAIVVAASVRGGRLESPWLAIALGIAVLSLADLVFAYATWHELYLIEGPPNLITILSDAPYMGAYAIIAVGAYALGRLEGTF
jgi:hypothetical protein